MTTMAAVVAELDEDEEMSKYEVFQRIGVLTRKLHDDATFAKDPAAQLAHAVMRAVAAKRPAWHSSQLEAPGVP